MKKNAYPTEQPGKLLPSLAATLGIFMLAGSELYGSNLKPSSSAQLIPTTEPGWPQFRGPRRDGICDEKNLLQSWPEGGPKLLWSAKGFGQGFSSPVISSDRLFITGDIGADVHLFAIDLSGRVLWKATNGFSWKTPYPGARATPAYSAGRVYHQNAHGRVACFNAENGKEEWAVDLLRRFDGNNITWGLSECLLVDDRAVYATAGGRDALVVALDKKTGSLLWKSEPLFDSENDKPVENASYVSPILVEFAGRRLLISCSLRHLFCMDADTGKLQWTRRMPTAYSVLAMMPTLVDDAIFMTAPHGKGGRLFRLVRPTQANGLIEVEEIWKTALDTCQGGAVLVNGKIIGSFYPGRKGWGAVDVKTGDLLYQESDIVKGAVLHADNRLYILSENGWMRLLEPTETKLEIKGEFRLAEASSNDAWAHPVIHHGRLYLRYHEELFCYDIKEQ